MKRVLSLMVLTLTSTVVFGFHCPADMSKIDEHLATNPELSSEQMTKIEELRAAGEQLHNDGKHHASVAVLAEAMSVLGIE